MWDLLFKFIDGDTNTIDTIKHDTNTESVKDTRHSPKILDAIDHLVEERLRFTESILEQLEHIDNILKDVLNKTE